MVRKGSGVRVPKRALRKRLLIASFQASTLRVRSPRGEVRATDRATADPALAAVGGDSIPPDVTTADPLRFQDDLESSRALLAEYKDVIARMRAEAEQFTTQARQAFTYVSGFFTIAQAAAVAALIQRGLGDSSRTAIVWLALAASVAVVGTALFAFLTERVRTYDAVGRKYLAEVSGNALKDQVSVEFEMVGGFKAEAKELEENVLVKKLKWLRWAQVFATGCFALIAAELITALAARL
jgi:hypothetical protein